MKHMDQTQQLPEDPIPAVDLPHPQTADIDFATPARMVETLLDVRREIFTGSPTGEPGLSDPRVARETEALGEAMAAVWKVDPPEAIVLAGGEITGRLGAYLCMRFNAALKARGFEPCFVADIAGGPDAFFQSGEGAEEDFEAGIDRWYALREQHEVALTIGLAPDLSTPYVNSLLDGALGEAYGRVVLMGTVPPEEARKGQALADGRSARDLIHALKRMPQGWVFSIPTGPEPIIGSVRTKSASAMICVLIAAFLHGLEGRPAAGTWSALREAQEMIDSFRENLAELVDIGGQVLRKIGRLYHLGRGSAGVLGVIDAAECIDTFSGNPIRIRGFCLNGGTCGMESLNIFGAMSARRPKLRAQVSEEAFRLAIAETQVGPSLTVALDLEGRRNLLLNDLLRLAVHSGGFARRLSLPECTAAGQWLMDWSWEFAVRTALNCFTTAAHILAGKTFGNRMIDIRMNSLGLFEQAVDLAGELSRISPEDARQALITAIYRGEPDPLAPSDIASHLAAAAGRSGLVARAVLLGNGIPLHDALTLQSKEPIVRKALAMRDSQ